MTTIAKTTTTPTLSRSQLVAAIQKYEKAFVDSPTFELDYLQGKLDELSKLEPVPGFDKRDDPSQPVVKLDSRVSVSIRSQWASHRANQARHLDHDPEAKKKFLKDFDAKTIAESREYDERFARRTAELTDDVRLDAEGPGDDLHPTTKAQLRSIAHLDSLSKRGQRGGGPDAAA